MAVYCSLGPSIAIATNDLATDYFFERVYIIGITWVLSGRVYRRACFLPFSQK